MNAFQGIDYEDEVDIRPVIRALIKKWRPIAGASLIAALVVFAATFQLPAVYQAEATVAITPSRTEVQFDPRIQTLADYELVSGTLVARRDALAALMKSNEVMQAVMDAVRNDLEPEQQTVAWLRNVGTVETAGDLINLEITYSDPETAALIANTWVTHYEQHVNQIYGNRSGTADSQIAEQVNEAQATYSAAQVALEAYEAQDPIETLQRELDTTLAVLESYQEARIAAQTKSADRNQEILDSYYQELVQIEGWLADAAGLRTQVSEDTGSTASNLGNILALITLRSRVFGGQQVIATGDGRNIGSGTSIDLQVNLSSPDVEAITVRDVDALISALEQRREAAQGRIEAFLEGLQTEDEPPQLEPLNARIEALTAEVTALQGEMEAATAEERELLQARDNAWETYQLLFSQQVEEQVASQTTSTEVRIADGAIVPEEPESRGLIRNTAIAAVLGAMVAAGIVLARAWWTEDFASDEVSRADPAQDAPPVGGKSEEGATSAPPFPDTAST